MFFRLSTWAVGALLLAILLGAAFLGVYVGRRVRHRADVREPFGVLQAALLGVVGLILAFGLSLAVGRYEARRAAVVDEANAIGTTFLRAQTIAEPGRTESLTLLRRYADASIALSKAVPTSGEAARAVAQQSQIQRRLWAIAGQSLSSSPVDSAPRLYVDSLNQMIDMQTVRVAGLSNRVPTAIIVLEVAGAATVLCLLAVHLSILGRGILTILLGVLLVTMVILITLDLDRPTRGLIRVPATPLISLRTSMQLPPAAAPPAT